MPRFTWKPAACALLTCLVLPLSALAAPHLASEMSVEFSRYMVAVQQSGLGDAHTAGIMDASADKFSALLALAMHGGPYSRCVYAPAPPATQQQLRTIADNWEFFRRVNDAVRQGQPVMEQIAGAVNTFSQNRAPLLELSEQVTSIIAMHQGSAMTITEAGRMSLLIERLDNNTRRILSEPAVNPETAFMVERDTNQLNDLVQGLLNGSPNLHTTPAKGEVHEKLLEMAKLFGSDKQARDIIQNNLKTLINVKGAVRTIVNDTARRDQLFQQLQDLHGKLPPGQECL